MKNTRHNMVRIDFLLILIACLSGVASPAVAHHCRGSHAGAPGCEPGGGGGGGEDTSAIPLVCSFSDAPGDSFLSDGMGQYHDNVDRVLCTTGDSQETKPASHIRFYSFASGNVRRAIRKMDFVIDESSCTNMDGCAIAPDGFFEASAIEDMEDGRFWVRAYDGELGPGVEPHIQDLPPDDYYNVIMGFDVLGTAQRWSFHLRSQAPPAADGLLCGQEDPTPALGDDITLYTWPDDDMDGRPDGYTFTTAPSLDTSTLPLPPLPEYDPDPSLNTRTATLCSNVGIDGSGCGGPGASDLCHVISQMEVRFTWHAVPQ
jgi:hypothetical protein